MAPHGTTLNGLIQKPLYKGAMNEQYYFSKKWLRKRQEVNRRCWGTCERCKAHPQTYVHHLSYARFEDEYLSDLLGLCSFCHAFIHGHSPYDPLVSHPSQLPLNFS